MGLETVRDYGLTICHARADSYDNGVAQFGFFPTYRRSPWK